MNDGLFQTEAPCCIRFSEKENPKLERAEDADYFSSYFRPETLIVLERMAEIPKRLSFAEATAGRISEKRLRSAVGEISHVWHT